MFSKTSLFAFSVLASTSLAEMAHAENKGLKAIRDLRVVVEYDNDPSTFAVWPYDAFSQPLSADEIERAVRIGLGSWQTVLPEMNVQFVNSRAEANMVIRFGDYGIADAGGMAWQNYDWNDKPDLECGVKKRGENAGGGWCSETANNIIVIEDGRFAMNAIDFMTTDQQHENYAWIFDPKKPHFGSAGDCGPKRPGANWSDACTDFSKAPHFNERKGVDLVYAIQHEFAHTLFDFRPDAHRASPYAAVDFFADKVYEPSKLVRLTNGSTSIIYPGDGSGWFNFRGMFPIDVETLKQQGFRTSYPRISGTILLKNRKGETFVTSDWKEALKKTAWSLQAAPLTRQQAQDSWFIVDVFARSQSQKILATGFGHSLVIKKDGSLWAWGQNNRGQLGDGSTNKSDAPKLIDKGPWASVAAGHEFTLALKSDGSLWAWGANDQGELGTGSNDSQLKPKQVGSEKNWQSISVGPLHSFAIKKDGTAYAWGYNAEGELGVGNNSEQWNVSRICPAGTPCQNKRWIAISAGSNHTLGLDTESKAWAWGRNDNGQLGNGTYDWTNLPTALPDAARWQAVQGGHEHSTGLKNGMIYTWGQNRFGQLGLGWADGNVNWPQGVSGRAQWNFLASGHWHSGGILPDGSWESWGYNLSGQLGNGNNSDSYTPVREAAKSTKWIEVAGHQQHTIATKNDGTVWTWGDNKNKPVQIPNFSR